MADDMFVKPLLKWNKKVIPFTTLTWSGTDTQASRQIEFEIPWNPYDKDFPKMSIAKGDVVELWFEGSDHAWFVGTITSREKTDAIGTARYVAKDFMHHLLQSTGTYIFKNTTPEAIAKKVCGDAAVPVTNLFKTGIKIKKMIFESQCLYDIIIKAYRKVKSETKKNYLPMMWGNKVEILEKGNPCGATLTQGVNITSANYSDNVDNMVDLVRIYNDKHKEVGTVKNDNNLKTYGVYQQAYQKESGVSATKAAKAMLYGTNREASVEALGDIRAMSGFSIEIKDPATGLTGTFFIVSDSHTFTNNTHTMTLDLAWKDTMEAGADTYKKQKTASSVGDTSVGGLSSSYTNATSKVAKEYNKYKMPTTQLSEAYFVEGKKLTSAYANQAETRAHTYYHSSVGCKKLTTERNTNLTVKIYKKYIYEIKKMRRYYFDKKGKLHNAVAHKPCPLCWEKAGYSTVSAKQQEKEVKKSVDTIQHAAITGGKIIEAAMRGQKYTDPRTPPGGIPSNVPK